MAALRRRKKKQEEEEEEEKTGLSFVRPFIHSFDNGAKRSGRNEVRAHKKGSRLAIIQMSNSPR